MKLLPNGNIEITVNLLPDAYAALSNIRERDKLNIPDAVNLAIMTLDAVGQKMTDEGTPINSPSE